MNKMMQLSVVALACAGLLGAQSATKAKVDDAAQTAKTKTKEAVSDKDVTYGKVRELTPGQKIVIDVNNAPDKEFNLADKDVAVTLAKGLKVGDTVKIQEHDTLGKTNKVMITKHSAPGIQYGDPK